MMPGSIVDVEIGGRLAGPFRVVVTYESRDVVLYLRAVPLATVAKEAAGALFLKGTYSLSLTSDGVVLDGRDRLDGDLRAELVARP